jgi:hypothetical protein
LVQGRFVDEWLGAEIARTPCSGCPNQAGCATGSGSGRACGGQTALIYQGRAHDIVPANLIVMAGMIAAADLTGETITYGGCPGNCAGPADCKCGRCQTGCRLGTVNAVATGCEGCPNAVKAACPSCDAHGGPCTGDCVQAGTAAPPKPICPNAPGCGKKGCPLAGN